MRRATRTSSVTQRAVSIEIISAFVVTDDDVQMLVEVNGCIAQTPIVPDDHLRNVHGAAPTCSLASAFLEARANDVTAPNTFWRNLT
jgi:hypothetical protein